MASRIVFRTARTVKDATRFTSTIPYATSKMAPASSPGVVGATTSKSSRVPGETPEQRVKRLRLAHQAAKKLPLTGMDRFIEISRPICDAAHRFTVDFLIYFTIIVALFCVYAIWDMVCFNRRRRAEWVQTLKKLDTDELIMARVAFLKDEATPEQMALVEDAYRQAEERGYRLPALIEPPEHATHFEEHIKPIFQKKPAEPGTGSGILGVFSSLFGGGDSESESTTITAVTDGAGDLISAVDSLQDTAQSAVKDAWEKEKENQREGGSLDRIGLESASGDQTATKKGWWPW